jgi:hypothetical protein
VTNAFKYAVNAFCKIKLLNETPMTTPRLRQRRRVLVMTAWSPCVLVASTARDVAGNDRPCPTLEGMRKMVASHAGMPSHILDKHIDPMSMESVPTTMSHFIRPVAVMMNPQLTPQTVSATDGPPRRNPETDADSSLTAWKYNGALNRIVLIPNAAKKLLNTRLPLGLLNSMGSGITARLACFST